MTKHRTDHLKFDVGRIRRATVGRLLLLGLLSLVAAVGIFAVVLWLFPETAKLPGARTSADWESLGDIANLITLSLVVGGGVFVFVEYINNEIQQRRESAETSFNIYRELFQRLTNPEDTAARRWIIQNIQPCGTSQPSEEWLGQTRTKLISTTEGWNADTPIGQFYLKQVLNTFDFIGFVAGNYWNMEDELVEWMSAPIAKVWERIGPYVENEASERNEPDFYKSAREFGEYCVKWRRDHYPKSVIIGDAT